MADRISKSLYKQLSSIEIQLLLKLIFHWRLSSTRGCLSLKVVFCQTPVLGLGLGVDFNFAWHNNDNNDNNDNNYNNNKNNPHLNFLEMNSTRG